MLKKEQWDDFDGLIIDGVQTYEDNLSTHDLCITGSAMLMEDLEADKVKILGRAEVRGMVTCDDIIIEGDCECGYTFVVDNAEVSGSLSVFRKIHAEFFACYGQTRCRGAKIYELDVGGEFTCVGKLKSERISVMGAFWVMGALHTQKLSIDSGQKSQADEIFSDSVVVKRSLLINEKEENTDYLLDCVNMECDKMNLSYCRIRTLSCIKGVIGPGCVIDEVICRKDVTISPEATVGKVRYL